MVESGSLWTDRVASLERKYHTILLCIEDEKNIMFTKTPTKKITMKVKEPKTLFNLGFLNKFHSNLVLNTRRHWAVDGSLIEKKDGKLSLG